MEYKISIEPTGIGVGYVVYIEAAKPEPRVLLRSYGGTLDEVLMRVSEMLKRHALNPWGAKK